MLIAIAILVTLLLPAYAVFTAWSGRSGGKLAWLLKTAAATGYMGFLTLIAPWFFMSSYLVWLWWALVAIAALIAFLAVRDRRWRYGEKTARLLAVAFEPVVGLGLLGYAALGLIYPPPVALDWPLVDGRFVVGQGGNSTMLNYHNDNRAQRFALDVLELDPFGRRAGGIDPKALEDYVIFDNEIVSPCDGSVLAVRDDRPDNPIGSTDLEELRGNHVIVACNDVEILLAHMRQGSVAVAAGETVAGGEVLGRVGNSGNTSEPHLHIHATRAGTGESPAEGDGVPMTFGGVFPVRNTIIER